MPQIEVNLDIDANGILHVSAPKGEPGKEKRSRSRRAPGLTDAEIQRDGSRDAEANRRGGPQAAGEQVQAATASDTLVHSVKKVGDRSTATRVGGRREGEDRGSDQGRRSAAEAARRDQGRAGGRRRRALATGRAEARARSCTRRRRRTARGSGAARGVPRRREAEEKVVDAEYTEVKKD